MNFHVGVRCSGSYSSPRCRHKDKNGIWCLYNVAHPARPLLRAAGVALIVALMPGASVAYDAPDGWTTAAPRPEIAPRFAYQQNSGCSGHGAFVIEAPNRPGLDGYWVKTFPVHGGQCYRFEAYRRVRNVACARCAALVRILWQDDHGHRVPCDRPVVRVARLKASYREPDYPTDGRTDSAGWTRVSGTYHAPTKATRAVVELHLRWAAGGRVEWSDIAFLPTKARKRIVRLATVHFRPEGGKTPAGNCRLFAPLIAKAAAQKADLVVLPETLTFYGTGLSYVEAAEPIPGPSTRYFGQLAAKYNLYIVAGLLERAGHLVYNVAVLIGPRGKVVGKYRKVCLPRSEASNGVAPGTDYPVFETRFGKVAMMVCYDGFFPEVARRLTNRGAEIIAWPVWGCNPLLARARAVENQVYVVSSTYTDIKQDWMVSAVFDYTGKTIALAKNWGDVVVAEVDLNHPVQWISLGNYKEEFPRHQPPPDCP